MWNKYTPGDHVYIFSFSNTVFSNHYVVTDSGKKSFEQEYKNKPYQELGTDDNIHLNQLVLLECTWNSYSINDKTLNVTYCKTYDLGNNTGVDLPDFPTDYVDPYGNSSILVK